MAHLSLRVFFFSEMLLMFHKILLQGFHQRTAKWPVVVISKASLNSLIVN